MIVKVNGVDRQLPEATDVASLLKQLGRDPEAGSIAVAVNMQVVAKEQLAKRQLADGDRIDVVAAVGGG